MADKLGIGIIGFGNWARTAYVDTLGDIEDASVVAVSARSDATLRAAQKAFTTDIVDYHNYHDLLVDNDVDAVLIATPNSLHAEIATSALKAGKHVFLEAPFGDSPDQTFSFIDQAEEIIAGRQGGQIFQGDLELGYIPVVHHVCELLSDGALGDLLSVSVRLWTNWGVDGAAENAESTRLGFYVWTGPWYLQLLDLLVGRLPERVSVTGVRAVNGVLMDHGWASLDYGKTDGPRLIGRFEYNLLAIDGQDIIIEAVGTKGEVWADLTTGKVRHRTKGDNGWQTVCIPPAEPIVAFAGMRECLAGFVCAITRGGPVIADLAACRRIHEVCFAAQRAADEGITVELNSGPRG